MCIQNEAVSLAWARKSPLCLITTPWFKADLWFKCCSWELVLEVFAVLPSWSVNQYILARILGSPFLASESVTLEQICLTRFMTRFMSE